MAGWFVIHSAMRRKGDRGKPAFCVVWHSVHTTPTDCKKKQAKSRGKRKGKRRTKGEKSRSERSRYIEGDKGGNLRRPVVAGHRPQLVEKGSCLAVVVGDRESGRRRAAHRNVVVERLKHGTCGDGTLGGHVGVGQGPCLYSIQGGEGAAGRVADGNRKPGVRFVAMSGAVGIILPACVTPRFAQALSHNAVPTTGGGRVLAPSRLLVGFVACGGVCCGGPIVVLSQYRRFGDCGWHGLVYCGGL
jgi:hypothetical protein